MNEYLIQSNGWKTYIILSVLSILITYAINSIFLTTDLYYQLFGERLAFERIDDMLNIHKRWQGVSYIILPFFVLLRAFYTSIFLYTGIFFTELKIEFCKIIKVALLSDFIYILAGLVKLIILIFFKQVNTLDDLQFQPFSIMELLNKNTVDPLFVYPLSLINIFELGYFLILAWLLVGVINEANGERPVKFGKSLQLVTTSYGSGLLLWVVLVMFITLNLS